MTAIVIGALLIGLTLGLLGSGGSALTVPVLVYFVGHDAKVSIAESMAIVGLICIGAAYPYACKKSVDWRSVIYFGVPGMAGTLIGAWLGGLSSNALQLSVFGIVLVLAAIFMLNRAFQKQKTTADVNCETSSEFPNQAIAETVDSNTEHHLSGFKQWLIIPEGVIVGVVTGFVGVGGGFLIVPALMIFAKLSTRVAIGTSLVIIVMKSFIGFIKYEHYLLQHDMNVDFTTIVMFALIGIVGSIIGQHLNSKMNQNTLQKVFAIFLVAIGVYIIASESRKLFNPSTNITSARISTVVPSRIASPLVSPLNQPEHEFHEKDQRTAHRTSIV